MKIIINESRFLKLKKVFQDFFDQILIDYKKLADDGELYYSADFTIEHLKKINMVDLYLETKPKTIKVVLEFEREVPIDEDVLYQIKKEFIDLFGPTNIIYDEKILKK